MLFRTFQLFVHFIIKMRNDVRESIKQFLTDYTIILFLRDGL